MKIILKRKRRTKWGLDGKIYINGRCVGDSTEHPRWRLPPGTYPITREWIPFSQRNGTAKNIHGEISVGQLTCSGLVINTKYTYRLIRRHINRMLWEGKEVWLEIV